MLIRRRHRHLLRRANRDRETNPIFCDSHASANFLLRAVAAAKRKLYTSRIGCLLQRRRMNSLAKTNPVGTDVYSGRNDFGLRAKS